MQLEAVSVEHHSPDQIYGWEAGPEIGSMSQEPTSKQTQKQSQ
jgi:hypothetical protein